MRVLFVIDCLGSGGAQRQMVNLSLGLTRCGHAVEFFVYYPEHKHFASSLQEAGIPVHCHSKRRRFSMAPLLELRRLLKTNRYDAALAFLPTPSLYAELGRIGIRRMPLVVSERSTYAGESLPAGTWLLQQAHRLAHHITVNSHSQRERMERMFPWMRGRATTIYNGVDLARFSPQWDSNGRAGPLRLLVLSSVVPRKNAAGLVRALACHRDRYGDACVVRWAGQVASDAVSQTEYAEANKLLADLKLTDRWQWLGERKDIPELLRSHDAVIHPSLYEGLPNAICESLACGRPVLASDVCDHPRLVQEDVTGLLFDPTRPDQIAEAIHKCCRLSPAERMRMGQQARRYAEKELSMDAYVSRYGELLSRLAGHGSDRS